MVLAVIGLLLVVGGGILADPAVLLVGLVASTASWLRRRLPVDLAVPVAAAVLLAASITAGLAAGLLHQDLLKAPRALAAAYLVGAAVALLRSLAGGPVGGPPPTRGAGLLAYVPAVLALAIGLLQSVSVSVAKSWAFWGTDLAHHMTTLKIVQAAGALDYDVSGYPRGLHMLAALASVPSAPTGVDGLMAYDLRLVAALTWLATGLLLATGASLALRLARLLGRPARVGVLAGVLFGTAALLTNTFVLSFVYFGAAPSLLAGTVLLLLPLAGAAGLLRAARLGTVAAWAALCLVCLAHLWQGLLLAPVGAGALLLLVRVPRLTADLRSRAARRALGGGLIAVAAAVALAVPAVAGLRQVGGTAVTSAAGSLAGEPWVVLVPALGTLVLLLRPLRHAWASLLAGSAAGLLASGVVVLLSSGHPADLDQYYPAKLLWFLTILLGPLLAVASVTVADVAARSCWGAAGRLGQAAFVVRWTGASLVVALAAAFWLPYLLGVESATAGTWHRAAPDQRQVPTAFPDWSAYRYELATRFGPDDRAEVVVPYLVANASSDPFGTRVVSELLAFLTDRPEVLGGRATVCQEIEQLAGDRPAVVLTQQPAGSVLDSMAEAGCTGRAPVVRVSVGQG